MMRKRKASSSITVLMDFLWPIRYGTVQIYPKLRLAMTITYLFLASLQNRELASNH